MKNISFSSKSEKADFRGCAGPAENPTGFAFNEGWMDVEMAPFLCYASYLILDTVAGDRGECDGSLWGMGHMGGSRVLFSNAGLADCFALPGHSNPVSWRAPGNSGPWRVSSFRIGRLSSGAEAPKVNRGVL